MWALLSELAAYLGFWLAGLGEVKDVRQIQAGQSAVETSFFVEHVLDAESEKLFDYLEKKPQDN